MTQDLVVKTPNITLLPLADLVIPPWNPRKFMDEGEMLDLVAYLEKGGFVPRILVFKNTDQPQFEVISGQRRVEAYRRLGRERIEAEIMDITLEEARVMANTSNQGAEVYWLDKYMNWESFMADYPGSQEQIAAKLGVARVWITRSVNLMKVLNDSARGKIQQSLGILAEKDPAKNNGNSGVGQALTDSPKTLEKDPTQKASWRLSEEGAYPLTLFWDGQSLPDAQTQIEKALPVILSRQLSGPQVKSLEEWAKGGRNPEDFTSSPETFEVAGQGGKGQKPEGMKNTFDTNEVIWDNLPKNVKVRKTPDGYKVSMFLSDSEGPVGVLGAMMGMAKLKEPYNPTWENQLIGMVALIKKRVQQGLSHPGHQEQQKGGELLPVSLSAEGSKNQETQDPQDQKNQPGEIAASRDGSQLPIGQPRIDSTLESAHSSGGAQLEASTQSAKAEAVLANDNKESTPSTELGIWGQIKAGVKARMGATSKEAQDALVRDAKQAINYQIRKVMRGFLKDIF